MPVWRGCSVARLSRNCSGARNTIRLSDAPLPSLEGIQAQAA